MLEATRNDEGIPRPESDRRLDAPRVAHRDVQRAVDDQEELVGVLVHVPDVIAAGFGDLDVVRVHAAGDPRAVEVVELRQRLPDVDRLRARPVDPIHRAPAYGAPAIGLTSIDASRPPMAGR